MVLGCQVLGLLLLLLLRALEGEHWNWKEVLSWLQRQCCIQHRLLGTDPASFRCPQTRPLWPEWQKKARRCRHPHELQQQHKKTTRLWKLPGYCSLLL